MKRYLLFFMITALILFFASPVLAEIEMKAQVDKNKLTTDELLTYKLIITSDEKNIPRLQLPKFEGFNVISQAQSSTISFAKSNIKKIIVFAFILRPKEVGEFKIEPTQINFEGKTYKTEVFKIKIIQGKTKPLKPPRKEEVLPQEQPGEQGQKTTL